MRALGDLLDARRADRHRADARRGDRGRRGLRRRRHPPARRPAAARGRRSPSCAAPRARRRRHQAARRPSPRCSAHAGPAVVFEDYADLSARIDDPALDDHGRLGARAAQRRPARRRRACPSGACCRSRRSCSRQGVRDMVRISDARMSGTSYGTCVLHVAPESFVGGPLALVRDGDPITLDVAGPPPRPATSTTAELARRRAALDAAPRRATQRGYGALFAAARHPGRRGLRLRLPPPGPRRARARDPLRLSAAAARPPRRELARPDARPRSAAAGSTWRCARSAASSRP